MEDLNKWKDSEGEWRQMGPDQPDFLSKIWIEAGVKKETNI